MPDPANGGETYHRTGDWRESVLGFGWMEWLRMAGASALHISLGDKMKTVFAALALLIGIAACDTRRGQDTGRVGETTDTGGVTTGAPDTSMVTSDTMQADTANRAGDTNRDTAGGY